MKHAFQTLVAAAAVATIVGAATPALAAISKDDAKCHAAIAKNITKYQGGLVKNLLACHKSRSAVKAPFTYATDCSNVTTADAKGKNGPAKIKIKAALHKSCDGVVADILPLYPRCPSPVKTVDDVGTSGIDSIDELSDCLTSLSEAYVSRAGAQFMGAPIGRCYGDITTPHVDEPTSTLCTTNADCSAGQNDNVCTAPTKAQQACQGAIGKAAAKALGTAAKTRSKCQAGVEKLLPASLDYAAACNGPAGDTGGVIKAAQDALDLAIDTSCAPAILSQDDLHQLGMCGQDATTLKSCITQRVVKPIGNGLVAASLELPGTCAGRADVVINAAYGKKLSNTRLDSGWTGLAQDVDVVDRSLGGVKLENCDADCENCQVKMDTTNGYCRCENDPTVKCGTVEGADAACGASAKCVGGSNEGATCVTGATCNSGVCGAATCHCMFGPPLALSSGGVPVCVVNRFGSEFSGTTGAVGEYNVLTQTRALVHTSTHNIAPCPVCTTVGTATTGTCSYGPRAGKACHVDANHPDFGNSSFDCPPDPATNVSGAGLNLALSFSSGSTTLTATITGANCGAGTCHCSECSGDHLIGCNSTADCTPFGAGTCGVNLGSDNPKQNACTGGVANCGSDNLCSAGPFDSFCDGAVGLKSNGDGYLPCNSDADCTVGSVGVDAGTCTNVVQRRCFATTITAQGKPGIFNSEGVSAFCSAATGNAGVNKAGGLPGPGRVKLDFDFNVFCPGATPSTISTTQFEEPGGSSCN